MSKFTESIEHYCDGLTVAPGAAACCVECLNIYGIEETNDVDAMQEELYRLEASSFSWSQCDSCGSTFGGDRHEAHGLSYADNGKLNHEIYHLSICTDCLLFHANGDEPEEWTRTPQDYRALNYG